MERQPIAGAHVYDSIAIRYINMDPDAPHRYLPEVDLFVDGSNRPFLLDTGALSSHLADDEFAKKYPVKERSQAKSASGMTKECDVISPEIVSIGNQRFFQPSLKRCVGRTMNIFGLDFLGKGSFQIDLKNKRLNLLGKLPAGPQHSIKKIQRGHLMIPMRIGEEEVTVLFDTGADITVIDYDYVKNHPDLFTFIRDEVNEDGNGVKTPSKLYLCASIQIGSMHFENVEVSADVFPQFLKEAMESAPVILGTNIIEKAKWSFDIQGEKWIIETY